MELMARKGMHPKRQNKKQKQKSALMIKSIAIHLAERQKIAPLFVLQ